MNGAPIKLSSVSGNNLGQTEASASMRLKRWLVFIFVLCMGTHVACLIVGKFLLTDWRWENLPVHAAVEMAGGLIALWVARILLALERRGIGTSFNVWIAGALIGMGVLDGLHALEHAGQTFVWLHSTATLFGGLLFALVWLPKSWGPRVSGWWPWAVFTSLVAFGIWSMLLPEETPRMIVMDPHGSKVFSPWARVLNVAGGILLLLAAIRLTAAYWQKRSLDDLLFCLPCFLFGAAAIMFDQSQLWDLPWWGWHFLRLAAFGVALWFIVLSETRDRVAQGQLAVELADLRVNLETRVAEITRELQYNEERSRLVVETASDGIITIDAQGTVDSYNPGAQHIFGWTAEEVMGNNVKMLMPAPYREEHDTYLENYRETRQPQVIGKGREVRGKRKDGSEFPMYLAVEEGFLDGVPMYTGVVRDISELHQARESMEAVNLELGLQNAIKSRLAALDDCMRGEPDPARLGDEVLNFLAEDLGILTGAFFVLEENEETLRRVAMFAGDPGDSDQVIRVGEGLTGEVAKTGRRMRLAEVPPDFLTIRSALGVSAPQEVLILPVTVSDAVNGIIEVASTSTFSDADLDFLETAVSHIGVNLEGARAHRKMSRLLAQTQEQAQALASQQSELQSTNEELGEQAQVLEASRKELETANLSLQEQKKAIEAAKERIERQAREVEQASQYKSEFLANMSHELRTPLNSLLILSKMLGDNKPGTLNEKQVTFARTIHRSGSDLLDLINDILDLSKVEAGRLEFYLESAIIDQLLADLKNQFQHVADEKHLAFVLHRDEDVPETICTDAKRLQQVLKNLLSNAFKFTREGEVRLRVRRPLPEECAESSDPDRVIAFEVSDSGIGIPEDKQQAIFEAFKQADGSTSRNYGGTGLGLSIAREFSQRLGGGVHVKSKPNEGSSFTLVISDSPAQSDHPLDATLPAESAAAPPAAKRSTRVKPLVLLVEDDIDFAGILAELARERGFDCLHADNGRTGLEMARTHLPDAILMDIQMPIMSGYQVKENLEKDPETREIPVHFMSVIEPGPEARRLGYAGYLTKPVEADDLQALFQRIGVASEPQQRILIVEDDPVQQAHLVSSLQEHGVPSDICASAEAARKHLRDQAYAAIILDLGLEGDETGIDLLESLKEVPGFKLPPVIVYTAKDMDAHELEQLHTFTDRIVSKTGSDQKQLLGLVDSFLGDLHPHGPSDKEQPDAESPPVESPKLEAPPPAAPKPETPAPTDPVHAPDLVGLRVLLVDDDIRNVFALSAVLEEAGLEITVANDGLQALQILDQQPDTEIVLMDIMMPEMNGLEATQKIREQERFAALPIIALTAKAMKGDREECLKAGASGYLSKPVHTEQLLECIRKLAGARKG